MKKYLLVSVLGLSLVSGTCFAAAGDVVFYNNNLKAIQSNDAVQFKIIVQPGSRVAYTSQLSAKAGANFTTLTSGAIGTQTTSFDVYIKNVAKGSDYVKCLSYVTYNATWAAQNIFGWNDGKNAECALGTQASVAGN